MKNKLDNFESFIKDSLDKHEVAYNAASWTAVSQVLDGAKKPFYKTKGFIAGAAAVLVAGAIFLSLPKETNQDIASNDNPRDYIEDQNGLNNVSIENDKTKSTNNINPDDRDYIAANNTSSDSEGLDQSNTELSNASLEKNADVKTNSGEIVNEDKPLDRDYSIENPTKNEGDLNTPNDNPRDYTPATTEEPKTRDYLATFNTKNAICEGNDINLKANLGKDVSKVEWKVDGKTIAKDRDYKYQPTTTGNKEITLIAKNKEGEIVATDVKTLTVNETPSTQLNITEEEFALVNKQTFTINDDLANVTWNFGDGTTSKESEVDHTYPKQGNYNLTYTVENENGCKASGTRKIAIKGYYNMRRDFGFSPDGDGSLDLFMPAELKLINQPIEMTIYSATSKQIVYQTNSVDQPWNGIDMKTGTMAPFGPYVWIVTLTNELGHEEVYKGNLTKASK